LTKGAEILVFKEKDMLYRDTIDYSVDVDAYWDRKEEKPFVFEVKEEHAKAWIENDEADDGVAISVASAAVAPAAVTYPAAAAVDEL
jgi:hypothetical protein